MTAPDDPSMSPTGESLSKEDPLAPLAERALEGDSNALEALCRALSGPLFRLAVRLLDHPEDARDATQEVLVLVATHLSQFRSESRLLTWAYAIATRHLLRTRKKLVRMRSMERLEGTIRMGLEVTAPTSVPEGDVRLLARETQIGCTQAMLACLSLEERVVIVLSEVLAADDALGARLTGISTVTYRKRLSRARNKLRPVLEELCGLARPDAPCSCTRQSRAKEIGNVPPPKITRLPVIANDVSVAMESLGALRRLGPLFAIDPPLAPPEDLWEQVRANLPALLGGLG